MKTYNIIRIVIAVFGLACWSHGLMVGLHFALLGIIGMNVWVEWITTRSKYWLCYNVFFFVVLTLFMMGLIS